MSRHVCHHPRCDLAVPPRVLACRAHWFELPGVLREKVLAAYTPRQEITKDVSSEYVEVIHEVKSYWDRDQ